MQRRFILAAVAALGLATSADAGGRFRTRSVAVSRTVTTTSGPTTAEAKATAQARLGRCGHFSAVPSGLYEGCGMSSVSAEDALARCCYSRSGMPVIQQATVRATNGLWFATKLFRPGATCNGPGCK